MPGKKEVSSGRRRPKALSKTNRVRAEVKDLDTDAQIKRYLVDELIDLARVIVLVLNPQGKIVFANPYLEETTGYSRAELKGHDALETLIPEGKRLELNNLLAEALTDGEGRKGIVPLLTKTGAERFIEWWFGRPLKNTRGRLIGLLLSGHDITERMRAEENLRAGEEKNLALREALPDLMFRLSRDGLVLDYRPPKDFPPVASLAEALGKPIAQVLPAPVSERILAVVREVLHSRDSRTIEYQLPAGSHPAGTGSSGTDRRDFEGRVVTCGEDEVLFIVRDITERNRAVRALRQSETRYRLLADNVTDIIWTIDTEGRFTYISPSVQKVRGYTPEEAMAQTMSMKMSPESLEMIKGKAGEIWDAETDGGRFNKSLRFEVQQDHKAGYKLWTEVTPSLLRDENGVIIGAIGITRDITDRKIAEERLRKSEASLRMAQELANLGNWELGLESGKLHVSDQLYRIFGISRGQGWGGFELSFFHPDDLLLISEAFQRAMNNCYEPVEFRIVRPSGEIRTVYCAEARIIQSESGRSRRAVGTLQDITNRKREEEARRESEKTARALLNVQTNAALLLDADGHIVDINEVAAGYLRRPSADLLGACVFDFFPAETARRWREMLQTVLRSEQPWFFEEKYPIGRNGPFFYFDSQIQPIAAREGRPTKAAVFIRDITATRRHEQEREAVHEILSVFFDKPDLGEIYRRVTEILAARLEFPVAVIGLYEPENRRIENVAISSEIEVDFPKRLPVDQSCIGRAVLEGRSVHVANLIVEKTIPDREIHRQGIHSFIASPMRAGGRILGGIALLDRRERPPMPSLVHSLEYIAGRLAAEIERKNAEDALRRSEALYHTMITSMAEGVMLCDIDGRVLACNESAERILHSSRSAIVGRPLADLFPEIAGDSSTAAHPLATALQTRQSRHDLLLGIGRARGENGWISMNVQPLLQEKSPESRTVILTFRDITERKKREEEILHYQKRLRWLASELTLVGERERRKLAMELHDQIGQMLAISKIRLSALQQSLDNPEYREPLQDIHDMISEVLKDVQSLTFELSSLILYQRGLEAAVHNFGERLFTRQELTFSCDSEGYSTELPENAKVILYRVICELLYNVARHADADAVRVVFNHRNGFTRVTVIDNGKGFDAAKVMKPDPSNDHFGLFSIREQVDFLGGEVLIDTHDGRGTRITVTIPRGPFHQMEHRR